MSPRVRQLRSLALRVLVCACVAAWVWIADAPDDASEASAQQRVEHTQRAKPRKRTRKRKKRRSRKRADKFNRTYVAFTLPFLPPGLSGCFAESAVCPDTPGLTFRGLLVARATMGYRWKALGVGLRAGIYGYSVDDPIRRASYDGHFAEGMAELRFAPLGRRLCIDPYVLLGVGIVQARLSSEAGKPQPAAFDNGYRGGWLVGGGVDYFFIPKGALGGAYEVFGMPTHTSLGGDAQFWSVRVQLTAYFNLFGGSRRVRTRR